MGGRNGERWARARLGCSALVLVLALAPNAPAAAHLGHIVVSAERYLKLDASEADTRLVVSVTLGETEGGRVLEAADRDRDGRVDASESEAYLAEWGAGLEREIGVEIDGEPAAISFTEPFLDPIGRVSPVPVTVEMVAHLPITSRESLIVVRDGMVRREIYDRTELAFRAHDGAEIVASGASESPTGRDADLAFGRTTGRPTPDSFAMRVRYPERSEPTSLGPIAIALSAAALALLGWFVRRRRA